jgi:uncharacterized DUF497 family protein
MDIVWDEDKNRLLKQTRNVSFEEVANILRNHSEVTIIGNPVHKGQVYIIVKLHEYIHVVPAVISDSGEVALKTIFRSRKYNKIYGGTNNAK